MKTKIILLFILVSFQLTAQEKFYTKSGTIQFESSVPSFEEVKATNTKVTAILKDDGTIAALALIKAFRFKIALMEEHFNENYIESSKFPKATFSGKINGFSMQSLSSNEKEFLLNGKLSIKGITTKISTKCFIKIIDGVISLHSKFTTKPEDFGIKIPKIVRNKIAQEVDVSLSFILKKK